MNFVPIHPIDTPRLRLRLIREGDLEHYHKRLTSDPEVAKYMLWSPSQDISHTAATIRRIQDGYASGERWHWAIARKEDDCLIGTIALLRFDGNAGSCSFAYMLGKDFWGQGYGTEALKAVFQFAFLEMEVSRIEADHMAENTASGAAMQKAGMTKGAVRPHQYKKTASFTMPWNIPLPGNNGRALSFKFQFILLFLRRECRGAQ